MKPFNKNLSLIQRSFRTLLLVSMVWGTTVTAADIPAGAPAYNVIFSPINGVPLIFRDAAGNELGRATNESLLQVQVSAEILKAATTPNGIDIQKLIASLPSQQAGNGQSYAAMRIPQEVHMMNGKILDPGSEVLLDLSQFAKLGVVQPAGATSARPPTRLSRPADPNIERFNDTLQNRGVVGQRPQAPYTPRERAPLTQSQVRAGDTSGRFLSSPTCSCARGACQMTSFFGYRQAVLQRARNGYGRLPEFHDGLDIGGGARTPIVAAADGCVKTRLTNRYGSWGLTVQLDHGNGMVTQYSHLDGFAPNVRENQCFQKGDLIGYMGSTGDAHGPHLHFGVYHNGRAEDPRKYLAANSNAGLSRTCQDLRQSEGKSDAVTTPLAQESRPNGQGAAVVR